jgi:hypothetical protein
MEPLDEAMAEPDWVGAILDGTGGLNASGTVQNGQTVRAEFVRRIRRSDLGAERELVLRAGLAALDRIMEGP